MIAFLATNKLSLYMETYKGNSIAATEKNYCLQPIAHFSRLHQVVHTEHELQQCDSVSNIATHGGE